MNPKEERKKSCHSFLLSLYFLFDIEVQRFSDLPEGLGQAIYSVKPGNSLNPKVLMANINLGLEKYSVKPGIPLKTILVNPKISVFILHFYFPPNSREIPCFLLCNNI